MNSSGKAPTGARRTSGRRLGDALVGIGESKWMEEPSGIRNESPILEGINTFCFLFKSSDVSLCIGRQILTLDTDF